MERAFENLRSNTKAIAIAKAVAITITFAALYYGVTMLNPALAKSSFMGVAFGKTLRFATMLKAFAVVTPFSIVGISFGTAAVDLQAGDAFGFFRNVAVLANGLFWCWVSIAIGRSVLKDLSVLFALGLTNATIVALKLAGAAMLVQGTVWGKLLTEAVQWKIITSTLMLMSGYLLVLAYEATRKGLKERGEGTASE